MHEGVDLALLTTTKVRRNARRMIPITAVIWSGDREYVIHPDIQKTLQAYQGKSSLL